LFVAVRFLHISDTHISAEPGFRLIAHDPSANLRALIEIINNLPFSFDFVLHTGDVVNDEKAESYAEAKKLLAGLKVPIYYASGNHDDARLLQGMIGIAQPTPRYDHDFFVGGVHFVVLDSRGSVDPGGHLTEDQLTWLGSHCALDGPPLVIILHHLPIVADVPWLDKIHTMPSAMIIDNHAQLLKTMRPARDRIRGIFYGHIHRAFQVMQEGLIFSSAPSVCGQFRTYPTLESAIPAPEEAPGYCLVTIDDVGRTLIQQYTFPHASNEGI
jgi:3',5'-cyclic AMP phosphodiesterase CpdA